MDTREIVDAIKREFEAFKAANDQRLAEVEQFGVASVETQAKVDRANVAISELQEKLDALENRLNRPQLGGVHGGIRPSDKQLMAYARWQGAAQGREVDPDEVDLELITRYNRAFRDWMRRGERASAESLSILNEMSVSSDPDGGVLVSPDLSGRVAMLVYETSPIRQYASIQEISTDALEGWTDLDEADASWVGETETRSGNTATPQLGTWRIPVHEQYAEPRATQKLLDDARIDVEGWLAGKVAGKFARNENTAFVTGNGVHRPRGFTTYTAGTPAGGGAASSWQVIEQVVSGSASAVTADGLIDLVFSLKSVYRQGAIFGMNRTTEREVRQLKDGQNNYLWQPDFTERAQARLLGFPVVEMPDMADISSNALPIVFGNLREAYQIVDRAGIRVLRDPYTTKGYVKFYTTKRVGGSVVNFEAIKLQKISA
jgi:HK97 family phage major capsid protein